MTLTFSQYSLLRLDISLQIGSLQPDLDGLRQMLNSLGQYNLGIFRCLQRPRSAFDRFPSNGTDD